MSSDPFALWQTQLDELTSEEKKEVEKMLDLAHRGKHISLQTYSSSLYMRYNFNRWDLMMKQVRKRLRG